MENFILLCRVVSLRVKKTTTNHTDTDTSLYNNLVMLLKSPNIGLLDQILDFDSFRTINTQIILVKA